VRCLLKPASSGPDSHRCCRINIPRYPRMDHELTRVSQVIGMYQTLLSRAGFRKGMDLYFQRHDGTAVTCDDFRAAMADANVVDLTQFERWYTQAGTPQVDFCL
jgi:hypothetical protein